MTIRLHYETVLAAVESFAAQALRLQVLDPSERDCGGFRCPEQWICEPLAAANTLASLAVLYMTPDSQYYHNSELSNRLHLAMRFLTHSQRADGTIDGYARGEIHATPTVAEAAHALFRAYRWLSREEEHQALLQRIEAFLRKGLEAIKSKPVFTAHDCWVAAAALVEFDKQFGDSAASGRAESYLQEGININREGVYDDRSPIYSMQSNAMLCNLAEKLNRPALLEYVRRSLNFLLYAFHPDGETATEFSDHSGRENGLPTGYSVWKNMSIIDHNGYYATAADLTLATYLRRIDNGLIRPNVNNPNRHFKGEAVSRFFTTADIGELLSIESERNNDWINRLPLPRQYERKYIQSNIARIQRDQTSLTIIGDKQILFAFRNGGAIIDGFRIKYIYHGFRDYTPAGLTIDGRKYLTQNQVIQYVYKPTSTRREVIPLNLQIFTQIEPTSDGLELRIVTQEETRIPLQLEFGLRKEGSLYIGEMEHNLAQTDVIFLDKEPARIVHGSNEIEINGGVTAHKIYSADGDWTMNHETARLLITPVTPYEGVIRITCR
jgi:hypothetical protein